MEEADILGDSIAIMANGDLRCVCMHACVWCVFYVYVCVCFCVCVCVVYGVHVCVCAFLCVCVCVCVCVVRVRFCAHVSQSRRSVYSCPPSLLTSDLGSSNYLKNKYAGYTVEMVVRSAYQEEMTGIVAKMIPGESIGWSSARSLRTHAAWRAGGPWVHRLWWLCTQVLFSSHLL